MTTHPTDPVPADRPPEVRTPCSEPDACDPATGEPCDRHETERAHAEGEHAFCGPTCEVEFPSEQLRNFILAKGYPGTAGMLDELLRRAAAGKPADAHTHRAAVLREAADKLGRMDYDTDSHDYGYDTYRDAWNGGVMEGAGLLRRMADEKPEASDG